MLFCERKITISFFLFLFSFKYRDVHVILYFFFLQTHKLFVMRGLGCGGCRGSGESPQRRKGLVLAPVAPPPPTDPPAPITPPTPVDPPKINGGWPGPPAPIKWAFPGGAMGDIPPKGIPIGLDCTIPIPMPGAAIETPIPCMPIPG